MMFFAPLTAPGRGTLPSPTSAAATELMLLCDGADAACCAQRASLLEVLLFFAAAAPRGGTRAARSINSVAASSAPSQQQKQATAVSCDHERSTGRKTSLGSPSNYFATGRTSNCLYSELISLKSLGHSLDKGRSKIF